MNAAGQTGARKILVDALKLQQALDSAQMLPIVRQEASKWLETVHSRDRTIDSLLYAGQMLRDGQDSSRAAYGHLLAIDRSKDVQIAQLKVQRTRGVLATILSALANVGLGYAAFKH